MQGKQDLQMTHSGCPTQMATGAFSGAVAGALWFPLEGLKKRAEAGALRTTNDFKKALMPRELWRGTSGFTFSVAATSMIQFGVKQAFIETSYSDQKAEQLAAAIGGAVGALASTAVEGCIINQQYLQSGPIAALRFMTSAATDFKPLRLWTGLSCIGIRELIFGYSMLEGASQVAHAVKEWSSPYYRPSNSVEAQLQILGIKTLFGISMSLLSHPFDMVATRMQKKQYEALKQIGSATKIKAIEVAYEVLKKEGARAFWKGGMWRCFLFTNVMLTMSELSLRCNDAVAQRDTMTFFTPTLKILEDRDATKRLE